MSLQQPIRNCARVEQPQWVLQALALKACASAGLADIPVGPVNHTHGATENRQLRQARRPACRMQTIVLSNAPRKR